MLFTKDEHEQKAIENEKFAQTLPSSVSGVEWAITATFYAAVHYVQAYFAKSGRSFSSHGARAAAILKDGAISSIYNDYQDLYNISRDARYEVMNLQPGHLTFAQNKLQDVKKIICKLL
ncbi:hypothetical protein H7849_23010 [Alloacidobacterium dinghuense]|uniref:HEPN domain-containing protein n=1 Tax=Alloacidobacterium dinghuense TaxID=2763107 RepID=A0A7G8BH47_9BACT|nr:hypothetical protein [Alloacidobacterium dinghuense]QNI31867.1 hypothetical protein H7849_23010 [Alloacidobacterium dinghuense]